MFNQLKPDIFIELQKKKKSRNDGKRECGKSGRILSKGMEVFQDQIIYMYYMYYMHMVHVYATQSICVVYVKDSVTMCYFHSSVCCSRSGIDLVLCVLSLAQWLAYWCSVDVCGMNACYKQGRRKGVGKEDALKVVVSMMEQRVISFVFSCAKVGDVLGRVRKSETAQPRLALKTVSRKPWPRIPCVPKGASSFLHRAGKEGVGKCGEQKSRSRSKWLHWFFKQLFSLPHLP